MCSKNQNNIDSSIWLQQILLLPGYQWSLSNTKGPAFAWLPWWPVFMRRWELIILFRCSEPWQAAVREGGREEEEGKKGGGEMEGRRGRPQRDPPEAAESQARLRGPAFPAASFPCSCPAEQSGHLSFPCRFWSIVLLPLSVSPLLSSQCHSLQLLRLMSFLERILSVPACWFLLLCLNKCKHDEGSFKQAQAEDLSCGTHGGEEE